MVHLWHCHLGFLNYHNVRSMGSHHIAKGVPLISRPHGLYNNYRFGKEVCEPIMKEVIHLQATKPLVLIHFNLWGEIHFLSMFFDGNLFFVTSINDHSKFIWIYFMWNKFETFQYFQHFKANVKLVFNTKIEIFWSD